MLRLFLLGLVSLLMLTAWSACKRRPIVHGDSGLTVVPEGASPGMLVRVSGDRAIFAGREATKVEIGGQAAAIANMVSDMEAEVMVPNVAAGQTTLTVSDDKRRDKNS